MLGHILVVCHGYCWLVNLTAMLLYRVPRYTYITSTCTLLRSDHRQLLSFQYTKYRTLTSHLLLYTTYTSTVSLLYFTAVVFTVNLFYFNAVFVYCKSVLFHYCFFFYNSSVQDMHIQNRKFYSHVVNMVNGYK